MRKLIVLEHLTLDGVIQAPAGQMKMPATASRMAGGAHLILTMCLEWP